MKRDEMRILLWACGAVALLNSNLAGETPRTKADRGFYPTGVYSSSQLDSVNNSNGNLVFKLPITTLAPSRGGQQVGLDLVYNSSIYDISQVYSFEPSPTPPQPVLTSKLVGSSQGGWRYSFLRGPAGVGGSAIDGYGLVYETRPTPVGGVICDSGDPATWRQHKLYFQTPDGGLHVLRRLNYTDVLGDGFFAWDPDNAANICRPPGADVPIPATAPVYLTTDGSYIRVQITDALCNTGGPNVWQNKQWVAYLPDGGRVSGCPQTTVIADRNGNEAYVYKDVNVAGDPVTVIENSVGRSIKITHLAPSGSFGARDAITRLDATDAANLTWTVYWGTSGPDATQGYICAAGDRTCSIGPQGFTSVERITLPNSLEYFFEYDSGTGGWGELSRVTLPQSSPPGVAAFSPKIEYVYANRALQRPLWQLLENPVQQRKLYYRDFQADGALTGDATTPRETWNYAFTKTQSTIQAPDGSSAVSSFFDLSAASDPLRGLIYKTVEPLGRVMERRWEQNKPIGNEALGTNVANPYVKTEYVTVGDAANTPAKTATKDFTYDRNGNVTSIAEYDWVAYSPSPGMRTGVPAGAALIRSSVNTMKFPVADAAAAPVVNETNAYWSSSSDPMRFAVSRTKTFAGDTGGSLRAFTQFTHDAKGNMTFDYRWSSSKAATAPATLDSGSAAVTQRTYDAYGNVTLVKDPGNNDTTMLYGTVCGVNGLYATQRTEPGPRTFTYGWNCPMGAVSSETDVENNVTTGTTFDRYGRPEFVTEAGLRKRAVIYDDAARVMRTAADLVTLNDAQTATASGYDDIGRPHSVRSTDEVAGTPALTETASGVKVKSLYWPPAGGLRYEAVSNPYRASLATGAAGIDEKMAWTRTMSDSLGRVKEVETFSGAIVPSPWNTGTQPASLGKVTTVYGAGEVTTTDESVKVRKMEYDGLGRLLRVTEDPNGLNYLTSYEYDALDNLTKVTQGAQERSFAYDSLSRLLCASNPEARVGTVSCAALPSSGAIRYTYDDNGNLLTRTDARGAAVTMTYNARNQVTAKTYSGTAAGSTPSVSYTYGGCAFGAGRLCTTASGAAAKAYVYDALGRVAASSQTMPGYTNPFAFAYSYNLADGMTEMTYPAGRKVAYDYYASGRVRLVRNGASSSASRWVNGDISYWPSGAAKSMTLGNGVVETTGLDNRLRMNSREAMKTVNLMSLAVGYEANGNVASETRTGVATVVYGYDGVNRLGSALQPGAWSQSYGYDRWANRWVSGNTGISLLLLVPTAGTQFGANNRLAQQQNGTALPGTPYDDAGNLISHPVIGAMSYDGENRLVTAANVGAPPQTSSYQYDGDGKRVKRTVGGDTTVYVYDAFGRLAAEMGGAADAAGPKYLTVDHLGSTRVVTDGAGSIAKCYDYLPYGEALTAGRVMSGKQTTAGWYRGCRFRRRIRRGG